MKKILTTIILCFSFNFNFSITAHALSADSLTPKEGEIRESEIYKLSDISIYNGFDYTANILKEYSLNYYENSGENLIWILDSLNQHQNIQYHVFEKNKSETSNEVEKLIKRIDNKVDIMQIGTLLDNDLLDTVKKSFESNPAKATVEMFIPIDEIDEDDGLYNALKEKNIPIYWNIEKENADMFSIEVAVGKYIIQPGDTLSDIALKYDTSVQKLLNDNKNIANPDLIYAYDYLIIK